MRTFSHHTLQLLLLWTKHKTKPFRAKRNRTSLHPAHSWRCDGGRWFWAVALKLMNSNILWKDNFRLSNYAHGSSLPLHLIGIPCQIAGARPSRCSDWYNFRMVLWGVPRIQGYLFFCFFSFFHLQPQQVRIHRRSAFITAYQYPAISL